MLYSELWCRPEAWSYFFKFILQDSTFTFEIRISKYILTSILNSTILSTALRKSQIRTSLKPTIFSEGGFVTVRAFEVKSYRNVCHMYVCFERMNHRDPINVRQILSLNSKSKILCNLLLHATPFLCWLHLFYVCYVFLFLNLILIKYTHMKSIINL